MVTGTKQDEAGQNLAIFKYHWGTKKERTVRIRYIYVDRSAT